MQELSCFRIEYIRNDIFYPEAGHMLAQRIVWKGGVAMQIAERKKTFTPKKRKEVTYNDTFRASIEITKMVTHQTHRMTQDFSNLVMENIYNSYKQYGRKRKRG